MTTHPTGRVLLTDHPWPGTAIESAVLADAGYQLVDGAPGDDVGALLRLAGDVDGILTCWAQVPRALVEASPRLRVVSRLGVGVDNIDVAAAAERGAVVTRVPDYCVEEVSDHVLALVLDWARGVTRCDRSLRAGGWLPEGLVLRRVRDLVVGIWGAGRNGLATGRKLAALGCTVLVDDRHPVRHGGFEQVTVDELLARSDVVSVHVPLGEATRGLVGAGTLARMREGSLLVNTARGAVVDVDALVAGLDAGRPGAAALDVLPHEPEIPAALAGRTDVVVTPHVAFSSVQSVAELRRRATEDLVRVLRGEPPHHPFPPPAAPPTPPPAAPAPTPPPAAPPAPSPAAPAPAPPPAVPPPPSPADG